MDSKTNEPGNLNSSLPFKLSPIYVWALSFGCIIGWGSFIMPGTSFLPNAGLLGTIIAVVIGGLLFAIVSQNISFMMGKMPDNGGSFAFVNRVLGRQHAFIAAWALSLAYLSLIWVNVNTFVLFFRYVLGDTFQWGINYQIGGYDIFLGEALTGIFILIMFGLLVCHGKKLTVILHSTLGVALLISVIALFIGILTNADMVAAFTPAFIPEGLKITQVYKILLFAPWMFIGFEAITHVSEDFGAQMRKHSIARLIMPLAIVMGIFVYCALSVVGAASFPEGYSSNAEYIANLGSHQGIESFPVLYSVSTYMGSKGIALFSIAIISALSTSMIGFYHVLANLLRSMAQAELLPQKYATLNKNGIPQKAIFLIMLVSIFIPFIGRTAAGWLTDATSISATIAYAYISGCCYLCAKKDNDIKHQHLGKTGVVISLSFFIFPLLTSIFFENVFATESYFLMAIWSIIGYGITAYISSNHPSEQQ